MFTSNSLSLNSSPRHVKVYVEQLISVLNTNEVWRYVMHICLEEINNIQSVIVFCFERVEASKTAWVLCGVVSS